MALCFCSNLTVFAQKHNYSKSVSFKVEKIKENTSLATGNQSWVSPSRGFKFVSITLALTNDSETPEAIDFDNFHLLNSKTKTKHKVEFVRTAGFIQFPAALKLSINKGKKKRVLVFIYPEFDTPRFLSLNENSIELN